MLFETVRKLNAAEGVLEKTDDLSYRARHLLKDIEARLFRKDRASREDYLEGEGEIVCKARFVTGGGRHELAFSIKRVERDAGVRRWLAVEGASLDCDAGRTRDGLYKLMLVGEIDLVDGPQETVRSRVEVAYQIHPDRSGLTAGFLQPFGEARPIRLCIIVNNEEMRVVDGAPVELGTRCNEVVQGRPEIVDGISHDQGQASLGKRDALEEVVAVTILIEFRLLTDVVWASAKEASGLVIEIDDMAVRPRGFQNRA